MMEGSGAESGAGSVAGSILVTNDPDSDPGGPKTYGSYGSLILVLTVLVSVPASSLLNK